MDRVITIDQGDLTTLVAMAAAADRQGTYLRVAYNGPGISFAIGQNVWTVPLGTDTGIPKSAGTSN